MLKETLFRAITVGVKTIIGRDYVKAVYCHLAYLTYIRVHHEKCWAGGSTSWNQDSWEKINNLRYADDTILMAESEKELKSLLMKVK